ncbi:MAG TPA: MBL fold metallo-hydrolase [Opitutales bacterium]|nr:MBL fold metallo-hydrolase [Opitutales bacterium]
MKTPSFRVLPAVAALLLAPTLLFSVQTTPDKVKAEPVRGGIFLIDGPLPNCVVLAGPDGTLLVDSGEDDAYAAAIGEAVTEIAPRPVRFLLNTHKHFDHVNGNAFFANKGATLIAQASVRAELVDEGNLPPEALPEIVFEDSMTFFFDGEEILLHHPETGGAHTFGDTVVYFRKADVLCAGDLFCNGMFPYLDPKGGNTEGIVKSLREAASLIGDKTIVIPGHGALSDKKGMLHYADLLEGAAHSITTLMEKGLSLKEIQAAKPTAPYDAELGALTITMFGKDYRTGPDRIVEIVYENNRARGIGRAQSGN